MGTITLSTSEYQDLIDSRDHALAMRNVATGATETLTASDLDLYLAAPSPLAFWRKNRGLTQSALAESVSLTQPHMAQAEQGKRGLSIGIYAKMAKVLRVRIEDLVPDDEHG